MATKKGAPSKDVIAPSGRADPPPILRDRDAAARLRAARMQLSRCASGRGPWGPDAADSGPKPGLV